MTAVGWIVLGVLAWSALAVAVGLSTGRWLGERTTEPGRLDVRSPRP